MNEYFEYIIPVLVILWAIGSWIRGLYKKSNATDDYSFEDLLAEEKNEVAVEEERFQEPTRDSTSPTENSIYNQEYYNEPDQFEHIRYAVEKLGVELPEEILDAAGIEVADRSSARKTEQKSELSNGAEIQGFDVVVEEVAAGDKSSPLAGLFRTPLRLNAIRDAIVLQSLFGRRIL